MQKSLRTMRLITSLHYFVLAVGASICLGTACLAHGGRRSATPRLKNTAPDANQIVQIDLGNEAGGWGYEPLDWLSGSLARHPKSRFFRATWDDIAGSMSSIITVLYDRHGKTLRYYCFGGHNAGGNPKDIVYAHYLYTGVTEPLVRQATEFAKCREQGVRSKYGQGPYPDAIRTAPTYATVGTPGAYCDSLLTFGCHREKLR